MGGNYGGRGGRGGSTFRHEGIENSKENSKEKKENKPSGVKISAEEIRTMVGKFLRDLSGNTNPKKVPRLLNRLSEETIRALSFMRTLKYVSSSRNTSRPRRSGRSGSPVKVGHLPRTSSRTSSLCLRMGPWLDATARRYILRRRTMLSSSSSTRLKACCARRSTTKCSACV